MLSTPCPPPSPQPKEAAPAPADQASHPVVSLLESQIIDLTRRSEWLTNDMIYQSVFGLAANHPVPAKARAAVSRSIRRLLKLGILSRTEYGILRLRNMALTAFTSLGTFWSRNPLLLECLEMS